MMKRRTFLACGGAAVLAGCVGTSPLIEGEAARNFVVQSVSVDPSGIARVTGRELEISNTKAGSDIQRSLERRMLGRGTRGGKPVRVNVRLKSVFLVSPGVSLLVGGSSTITADVSVVDANTGEVILAPTSVSASGGGYSPGGIIGAASRGSPEEDYSNTVGSFADNVSKRLLGNLASTAPVAPGVAAPSTVPSGGFNADRPAVWRL